MKYLISILFLLNIGCKNMSERMLDDCIKACNAANEPLESFNYNEEKQVYECFCGNKKDCEKK